jgi:hypothetical protein
MNRSMTETKTHEGLPQMRMFPARSTSGRLKRQIGFILFRQENHLIAGADPGNVYRRFINSMLR